MKDLIKKIAYLMFSVQESVLKFKLGKNLKTSYTNKSSKTIMSSTEHMTLSAETNKNIELVKKNVEDITKNNSSSKLLEYIKAAGTRVLRLYQADKILSLIGEEEGLICELRGLKAFYLNIFTLSGLSFKSEPIFIMREGDIEPLYMLHHFYRWYALKTNLPGFDYKSQQNLKKYLKNPNDKSLAALSIEDTLALKEAVARDREATDFVLGLIRETEGAQKTHKKMTDGGANI